MNLDTFLSLTNTHLKTANEPLIFKGLAKPASVLIAIIMRDEPMVLLTKRAMHLNVHAGQIGFAGGKLEAGETALQAALREAHEEIGLDPKFVTAYAQTEAFNTRSGFELVGIIATINPEFTLNINKNEVDEVFEVPLAFLMNPDNHIWRNRIFMGRERYFYAIPYKNYYIWGVTAGLIRHLWEKINPC
jgi:mutator protein MutT